LRAVWSQPLQADSGGSDPPSLQQLLMPHGRLLSTEPHCCDTHNYSAAGGTSAGIRQRHYRAARRPTWPPLCTASEDCGTDPHTRRRFSGIPTYARPANSLGPRKSLAKIASRIVAISVQAETTTCTEHVSNFLKRTAKSDRTEGFCDCEKIVLN
jgi:hypothetical protein